MNAHARIAWCYLRTSLQSAITYRVDYLLQAFGSLVQAAASLVVYAMMFGDGRTLNGWNLRTSMPVMGTYLVVSSVVAAWIAPNLRSVSANVRDGSFDYVLLLPANSQFLVSCHTFEPFALLDGVIGAGLIVYGSFAAGGPTVWAVILFLLLLIAAIATMYSLWLVVMTLCFWFPRVTNVSALLGIASRFGQFPASILPGWLRIFLGFIVPISTIFAVPSSVLAPRPSWDGPLVLLCYSVAALVGSHLLWRRALRRYSGASA